ncbi:hypothetical protein F5I97DRAFT_1832632 [Phlebopus sp. FC_14]|nr:hypothetical protein F5I97DRAFT_1832632 [Phlebopus sp. FC_14]
MFFADLGVKCLYRRHASLAGLAHHHSNCPPPLKAPPLLLPLPLRIASSLLPTTLPSIDFASARSSAQKYLAASRSLHDDPSFLFPTPSSTVFIPEQLNLDPRFIDACLAIQTHDDNPSPLSTTETLVSPTAFSFGNLSLSGDINKMAGDDVVLKPTSLIEKYPNAYSDFYGSGTPCVYKSGPEWPVRKGPQAQGIVREPRPVHGHAIQPTWVSIGTQIGDELESVGVMWTSINPLAYANAGEAKPFCPLIICVGVNPGSLTYDTAVAAAAVVKNILTEADFPDIEVAFVESVVTRSAGPKLLSFNPLLDRVPDLRKPFTPALGLSIAPRKSPYYEGTAALYFRLSNDDDRVMVLTCAHVARPPPVIPNTGMTQKKGSQRREEIVALGTMGYDNAVKAMMATIGDRLQSIDAWNNALRRLGDPVEGESEEVAERRNEYLDLVAKATREIQRVKELHSEVIENYTTLDQRTIGFVLHSEKIEVSVEPYKFTKDWALIELYKDKIDWTTFKGNKLWVGTSFSMSLSPSPSLSSLVAFSICCGKLSISEYGNTMFPQPQDRKNYSYPEDGLIQAYGVVQEAEMHNPQHLDVHGEKCLLVVKNGLSTGTTVGRVNGLESFRRIYKEYGISQKYLEIAVLPYDKAHGKFSDVGDSGSVVLDRAGRIVGILTGGSGPTDETDITYLTPYWWLQDQVKAKFPGCFLYDVVQ